MEHCKVPGSEEAEDTLLDQSKKKPLFGTVDDQGA